MTEQKKKLMDMITLAVNSLDKIESLVPAIVKMGERHIDYGGKKDATLLVLPLSIPLKQDFRSSSPELKGPGRWSIQSVNYHAKALCRDGRNKPHKTRDGGGPALS